MTTLVIYTVGSKQHGLGHVKRCLTLAHELQQREVGVIFVTEHETVGAETIRADGFTCYEYHPLDRSWVALGEQYHNLLIDIKDDPSETLIDAACPTFETITVVSASGYDPKLGDRVSTLDDTATATDLLSRLTDRGVAHA